MAFFWQCIIFSLWYVEICLSFWIFPLSKNKLCSFYELYFKKNLLSYHFFYLVVLLMFGVSVNLFPSLPNFARCPQDLWVFGLEIPQINTCIKSAVTRKRKLRRGIMAIRDVCVGEAV